MTCKSITCERSPKLVKMNEKILNNRTVIKIYDPTDIVSSGVTFSRNPNSIKHDYMLNAIIKNLKR